MKWSVVLITAFAAVITATTVVWMEVRQEREFRRLITEGDAALAEERTSEAIEAFSGALAFKPDSMLAHLKRAETYRRRGQPELEAALRDAREASTLDPTAPQPIELLGDINSAMGKYDSAIELYDRYLQLDDRAPRVLYKLALAHVRNGNPRHALDPVRKAIDFDERFAEAHYLLGVALRGDNRPDLAMRELGRAISLNPALIVAREELADLHLARGRSREAIEQLEAIAALEPSRPERRVQVALLLARSGRTDAAIVTLGRAAEQHPDSPVVLGALGRVWLETATADEDPVAVTKAITALQPLARRPDATSEELALLGEALLASGNAADAERTLQQAVTRQPVYPAAYRHLSRAARRRGHTAVARDADARYAALMP
jgi:tetratricopeptide (TPR) repeat protein